jgi:hypothetical protein
VSSKHWIEQALKKPEAEPKKSTGKRTKLVESLLKMKKEKG